MSGTFVLISYGMGGDWIDKAASGGYGEDYLRDRCKKIGVNTLNSVYQWSDTQRRFDDVRRIKHINPTAKIALGGDSLGDNELGDDVAALAQIGIEVDLIFGFQGSEWGKHTQITPNVKRALIIYNPNVIMTAGLGAYALPLVEPPVVATGESLYDGKWRVGNGGKTQVRYVQIEAPHPDDWGVAQDIAYHEILQLSKA
jgi:hypothetical protein